MSTYRILYNSKARLADPDKAKIIEAEFPEGGSFIYEDITKTEDIYAYLSGLDSEERIIIAGGDGTLNHLVNDIDGRPLSRELLYYPMGTGNDFFTDVDTNEGNKLVSLNKYIESLPTVTVNGKTSRFINGIGYGIDGYCCEEGDKLRAQGETNVNYAGIAIKGMLGKFKPLNAVITVDGVERKFSHVWLAPTMIGRYYGGGMNIAPEQERLNEEKKLSVVVFHTRSALKALVIFPNIFSGTHVKHNKTVEIFTGKNITVSFDNPTALQIDGETVSGVTAYTATAAE